MPDLDIVNFPPLLLFYRTFYIIYYTPEYKKLQEKSKKKTLHLHYRNITFLLQFQVFSNTFKRLFQKNEIASYKVLIIFIYFFY